MTPNLEMHKLMVSRAQREGFVLCLALGTLEAMRRGDWPLEAGIWTLGRPCFWEPLIELDPDALKQLQSADELSALEEIGSRSDADGMLDRMIAVIRTRLSAMPEKHWYARWSKDDSD